MHKLQINNTQFWPCDRLVNCPGCTKPLALWWLGSAGWLDGNDLANQIAEIALWPVAITLC